MNFIFERLVKMIGVEKLFLMAWNAFYPLALKKALESKPEWDEKFVEFVNDVVVMMTGAGKKASLADVKKPDEMKKVV